MAVVMAFEGRGFAELSTTGLKAEAVTQRAQKDLDRQMLEKLKEACADLEDVQERLEKLEAESLL